MTLKKVPPTPVIFTDLDGSLLDHDTYSHQPADALLSTLKNARVPVVLCTSKTAAEVRVLREELGNTDPFIVENGAAIFVPKTTVLERPKGASEQGEEWVIELCPARQRWIDTLAAAPDCYREAFENFAQMDQQRVVELTGLSADGAALSMKRGYGEPLHWTGDEALLAEFSVWLEQQGATVLRGGRFVHVAGASSKGKALMLLQGLLSDASEGDLVSIALGDGHNDVDMIASADFGVVIRSPAHQPPEVLNQEQLLITKEFGPQGWVEGVEHWLRYLKQQNQ